MSSGRWKAKRSWFYLEKQVWGGLDPLLEQNAQRSILLLQVEDSGSELQTFLPQVLTHKQTAGFNAHNSDRCSDKE